MALHRDIYWVGRQWAVTGYGIQACNQKQKGKFDIEADRLWQDGVLESMRALKWLNIDDFESAISAARKYYPEPPRKAAPPQQRVSALTETDLKETSRKANPIEPPRPVVQKFNMRIVGWPAKFVRQWHIRIQR
jgi:hypothetical protein